MKYQRYLQLKMQLKIEDFPLQEQSISSKTEAITRGTIQDRNNELPFYPDPIYRHPPRPPENLQP